MSDVLKPLIGLAAERPLTRAEAETAFNALFEGQGTPAHWNANLGTDDVALIGKILDDVEAGLCVDTDRVYATGYSNGAFLTSVLACASCFCLFGSGKTCPHCGQIW